MASTLRRLFARLGMTELFIVIAALVFGVLAGGVIVHRLEASPTSSQEQQQQQDEQGQQEQKKPKSHGHAKPAESPEPTDSPESD